VGVPGLDGPLPPPPPPQLTIRTTTPNTSRTSGAFLLRLSGIANMKTPASTPKPRMSVVEARMAASCGAVVLTTIGTETEAVPATVTITAGQLDSVIAAGSVQAMETIPLKPPAPGVTVAWTDPDCPGDEIVTLVGLTESVKLPVTVRATVVVAVRPPDVPVMVTVAGPAVAELLAVSVKTLVVVVLDGLKDAVTPLGRPDAASVTLPVKPFAGFTVIVLVPLLPSVTLKVLGASESVKSGGGATVRAIMVV
jgi:hypothetical protein